MDAFPYAANSSSGSDFPSKFDQFSGNSGGFNEISRSGTVPQFLVLDSESEELVRAQVEVGKKRVSEVKTLGAPKSHSEAERRRRERINAQLDMLRHLVPGSEKMDKATLLAEVIKHVKELKKNAIEASKYLLIPMDTDEIKVEQYNGESGDQTKIYFKASLCCDYSPEILSDLRQALDTLQLKVTDAEICILGSRFVTVFTLSDYEEDKIRDENRCRVLADSIHKALSSVLEKAAVSLECSPAMLFSNKRRRVSYFDSSSSSS